MPAILQNSQEFLSDFVSRAREAQERVWIQVMLFELEEETKIFEKILLSAAKKGLDVRLTIDWITMRYMQGTIKVVHFFTNSKKYNNRIKNINEMVIRLKKSGVTVVIVHTPPWIGKHITLGKRNHVKIFLIDNAYVWIGGINITKTTAQTIDFMVRFSQKHILSHIALQFTKNNPEKPEMDTYKQIDPYYKLVTDSGRRGKSLIYKEALYLITNAKKSIVLMSQYIPDGPLLTALVAKANSGIPVYVLTMQKKDDLIRRFPFNIFYIIYSKKVKNSPYLYTYYGLKKVHGKLLLVDDKEALFGSHNFIYMQAWLGIREISLKTSDPSLIQQFISYTSVLKKKYFLVS